MTDFLFANLLFAAVLWISDANASTPKMKSLHSTVVVKRGSDATLVCKGSDVEPFDANIVWNFNSQEVKQDGNRIIKEEWLPNRQATVSLHISNVTEKDTGDYSCIARVKNFDKFDHAEASVKLRLYRRILNVTASQPNVTIEEGRTRPLQCEVTYSEAVDIWIFWLFNGKMIEAKPFHRGNEQELSNRIVTNITTMVLKNAVLAQTGIYTCGANSTGVIRSQNISVTVKDLEGPTLVETKSNVKVFAGENATLSCDAVYPEAFFVDTFWIFNGSRIHSNDKYKESKSSPWLEQSEGSIKRMEIGLTIYNVGLNNSGDYTCALNTSLGLQLRNISVNVSWKPGAKTSAETNGQTGLLGTTLFIGLGLFFGLLTTVAVSLRLWRRQGRRPPGPIKPPPDPDARDFEYDVFLMYCRKDFSWVDKELLPLFNHNQVKYCVDILHFDLGKAFVQNMVEGIYKSRKVLAVWSANFVSSKYCRQELDYALQRSFEKSDSAVIVIRIDWTDPKQLPEPLQTKTFLDYSDSAERKGWEKRLIRHLKAPKQMIA